MPHHISNMLKLQIHLKAWFDAEFVANVVPFLGNPPPRVSQGVVVQKFNVSIITTNAKINSECHSSWIVKECDVKKLIVSQVKEISRKKFTQATIAPSKNTYFKHISYRVVSERIANQL